MFYKSTFGRVSCGLTPRSAALNHVVSSEHSEQKPTPANGKVLPIRFSLPAQRIASIPCLSYPLSPLCFPATLQLVLSQNYILQDLGSAKWFCWEENERWSANALIFWLIALHQALWFFLVQRRYCTRDGNPCCSQSFNSFASFVALSVWRIVCFLYSMAKASSMALQ